jgi:cell division protein FtsB
MYCYDHAPGISVGWVVAAFLLVFGAISFAGLVLTNRELEKAQADYESLRLKHEELVHGNNRYVDALLRRAREQITWELGRERP